MKMKGEIVQEIDNFKNMEKNYKKKKEEKNKAYEILVSTETNVSLHDLYLFYSEMVLFNERWKNEFLVLSYDFKNLRLDGATDKERAKVENIMKKLEESDYFFQTEVKKYNKLKSEKNGEERPKLYVSIWSRIIKVIIRTMMLLKNAGVMLTIVSLALGLYLSNLNLQFQQTDYTVTVNPQTLLSEKINTSKGNDGYSYSKVTAMSFNVDAFLKLNSGTIKSAYTLELGNDCFIRSSEECEINFVPVLGKVKAVLFGWMLPWENNKLQINHEQPSQTICYLEDEDLYVGIATFMMIVDNNKEPNFRLVTLIGKNNIKSKAKDDNEDDEYASINFGSSQNLKYRKQFFLDENQFISSVDIASYEDEIKEQLLDISPSFCPDKLELIEFSEENIKKIVVESKLKYTEIYG